MISSTLAAELARRHAPILVFSRDAAGRPEHFFPMDAEAYIRSAALYAPGPRLLVPRGQLSPHRLLELPAEATSDLYLVFASESALADGRLHMAVAARRALAFALIDRFRDWAYDAAMRVALRLLRRWVSGRLPRRVWEEARRRYAAFDLRHPNAPPPVLYYALVEAPPYWVLHFWFFYAFNDWATGHGGHNDHEGDWESIYLFLEPTPPYKVRWIAYAQHDTANLEDAQSPDVEWFFTHPVVYVACGSHASYFRPGVHGGLDYAFGDAGIAVGPPSGQLYGWPRLPQSRRPHKWRYWRLQPLADTPWANHFRGFWGVRVVTTGWWHRLAHVSGPGGPIWLPGVNRRRPQWEAPLSWAGFRRRPWELWKPRP